MRQWETEQTFVLICKKCGKKLDDGKGRDPARALAKSLKRVCKPLVGKKNFKVIMTSCLKVCPKAQITLTILAPNKRPELLTVLPEEGEAAAAAVNARISK